MGKDMVLALFSMLLELRMPVNGLKIKRMVKQYIYRKMEELSLELFKMTRCRIGKKKVQMVQILGLIIRFSLSL